MSMLDYHPFIGPFREYKGESESTENEAFGDDQTTDGSMLAGGSEYMCPECGADMNPPDHVCPECGYQTTGRFD